MKSKSLHSSYKLLFVETQAFNCTQNLNWPSKFICDTQYREASEKS